MALLNRHIIITTPLVMRRSDIVFRLPRLAQVFQLCLLASKSFFDLLKYP